MHVVRGACHDLFIGSLHSHNTISTLYQTLYPCLWSEVFTNSEEVVDKSCLLCEKFVPWGEDLRIYIMLF